MNRQLLSIAPLVIFIILLFNACTEDPYRVISFEDDLKLLEKVEDVIILEDGASMVAVSGRLQGKILTASSRGLQGRSLGWFKRDLIESGDYLNNINRLGGLGRINFGPEIGKYAIMFEPGTEQTADNIVPSPELTNKQFKFIEQGAYSVTYGAQMKLRNANNFTFTFDIKRRLTLIRKSEIEREFQINLSNEVSQVAIGAETMIKNAGEEKWTKENGLLSLWDLACITPSKNTVVIIPLTKTADSITNYFTDIKGRIEIKDSVVIYKADARYMNKIGIQPELCKNIFGSYDPDQNLLTIVKYNLDATGTYVNSHWEHTDPYDGDVINVFNGMINKKEGWHWPFYELETSSSSYEMEVGDVQKHFQNVYLFEGPKEELSEISKRVLGIHLDELKV